MKSVLAIRAQAALCRQLAIREPAKRVHWLAEAERWSCLERDEISALFTECNVIQSANRAYGALKAIASPTPKSPLLPACANRMPN
jgi:hypothetical protein